MATCTNAEPRSTSAPDVLDRDGSVRVEDRAEANRVIAAWWAAKAAKQHTDEELAAEGERLRQQEPGEQNKRADEELKRKGVDFAGAYAAFNRGDHGEVERFLQALALRAPAVRVRAGSSRPVRRPRERRATSRARARSPDRPGRRGRPDDDSDLARSLAGVIAERGPTSASRLATEVGRRKADVLAVLHGGAFEQVGKGRSARWDSVSPVRTFDACEASERWRCSVATATEIIFGDDGFLERGYVASHNGNGRVLVTELGLEFATASLGFLDEASFAVLSPEERPA